MEVNDLNQPNALSEPDYTPEELGRLRRVHTNTIRRMFLNEPGVIRFGRPAWRNKRQRFILRIPKSVADRVFRRMTVGEKVA